MFCAKAYMKLYAKSAMNAACVNTPVKKVATKYSHRSQPPMYAKMCQPNGNCLTIGIPMESGCGVQSAKILNIWNTTASLHGISAPTAARI